MNHIYNKFYYYFREDTQTEAMIEESEDEEGFDEESLDFDVQPGPGVSKILSQEDVETPKKINPSLFICHKY